METKAVLICCYEIPGLYLCVAMGDWGCTVVCCCGDQGCTYMLLWDTRTVLMCCYGRPGLYLGVAMGNNGCTAVCGD